MLDSTARPLAVCAALMVGATAGAQEGFPVDVEMIRPGLSPMGGFGIDAPHAIETKTWSAGALLQYEHTPLRLFEDDVLVGSLVQHRTVLQVHAGISASKRTSFSIMVPVGVHFADADEERASSGAGLGDMGITGRVHVGPWGRFSLGVVGTLLLPTGNKDLYMGERLPRLRAGLLGYTDLGRVKLLTNLLTMIREPVVTGFDFTATSEIEIDLGVQGQAIPGTLDVIGELVSRIGLAAGRDGGRLSSELVAGVRYFPGKDLRIDVALGRGLTSGFGATGVRAMLGLTYVHVPRPRPVVEPPPPPPVVVDEPLPEKEDPPPLPAPLPVEVAPVAALQGERIEIRDPIEFEQGTTTLRSSAGDVLDGVADVILTEPAIGHVVIEGHASAEGGYAYNYELSRERARVIYEALILRGVHPKRMSYRGAGEVERVAEGDTQEARERNRRVVFQVVRQYAPGEARPALGSEVLLPWSGEAHQVVDPGPVPVPATLPTEEPPPVEESTPDPVPTDRFDDASFEAPLDDEPVFDADPATDDVAPPAPTAAEPPSAPPAAGDPADEGRDAPDDPAPAPPPPADDTPEPSP